MKSYLPKIVVANDPLRLDDFLTGIFYQKGYSTWSALLKEASEDPQIPPASLQVEHLFPQHPYFPIGIELDDTGFLAATSTWVPGTGSCHLPPFEQPFSMIPYVVTPTKLFTSTELSLPPSVWFKQNENHLTVLVLAWAYALSARWAEIFSQASPLEYTDSQAEWSATPTCDNTEAIVHVGNVSDDAARWWAAIVSPGQGWTASLSCGRCKLMSLVHNIGITSSDTVIQRLEEQNAKSSTLPEP